MKKWYSKIERVTGSVVKRKQYDNSTRSFNKPFVWLEEQREAKPVFDEETHKLVKTVIQPDLSDLQVDVPPDTKRVLGYNIVALNAQELQRVLDDKVDRTNNQMARAVELILTKIATNNGVALKRSDFPAKVWTAINNRRALRGQGEI